MDGLYGCTKLNESRLIRMITGCCVFSLSPLSLSLTFMSLFIHILYCIYIYICTYIYIYGGPFFLACVGGREGWAVGGWGGEGKKQLV